MTIREKAYLIMKIVGEPIEPNEYCAEVIRRIMKVLDNRCKNDRRKKAERE